MTRYEIITLIDITRVSCSRSETDKIKLGQQANFNSLIQSIGLRANITWDKDPIKIDGQLPLPLEGRCCFWSWQFETEHNDLFLKESDPVGHLINDLHGVPIVSDLTNSVDIHPPAIQTRGSMTNTWIKII